MSQNSNESLSLVEQQIKLLREGHFETLRDMIKKGKLPLDTRFITDTPNNRTILHFIVMRKGNDRLKLLEWILINYISEIDINAQTDNGYTSLAMAAAFDNTEAMKLLIAHGADIRIKTASEKTALDICKERLPLQVDSLERAIIDRKEGKLPLPKPIFLTEADLAPSVQNRTTVKESWNQFKNRTYATLPFLKRSSRKIQEQELLLGKKNQ